MRRSFRRESVQDRAGLAMLAHDDRTLAKIEEAEAGRYIRPRPAAGRAESVGAVVDSLAAAPCVHSFFQSCCLIAHAPSPPCQAITANKLCSLYLCQLYLSFGSYKVQVSFGSCKVQVVRLRFFVLPRCRWCKRQGIVPRRAAVPLAAVIPAHAPHRRAAPVISVASLHTFAPTDR